MWICSFILSAAFNNLKSFRVRPQSPREVIDCCRICTSFLPGEPQIIIGNDKSFTYDSVFEMASDQRDIYKKVIEPYVDTWVIVDYWFIAI